MAFIIGANSANPSIAPQNGIFGYGTPGSAPYSTATNIVSSSGVVASDVSGVGTARNGVAATMYGGDKAIFAYGSTNVSNLVSSSGVLAADVSGVGTSRSGLKGCKYGDDKAIFAFGYAGGGTPGYISTSNLVSNVGVIGSDVSGVGTGRRYLGAAGYGEDKGIFAYGYAAGGVTHSTKNLVNNSGVVASDASGVGTARWTLSSATYGTDKAIFGYGAVGSGGGGGFPAYATVSITNLVNNSGVVATDTTGVGTVRTYPGACGYGEDKAIFGYGATHNPPGNMMNLTNLVNNSGVVAADVTGVGTARYELDATGFGY